MLMPEEIENQQFEVSFRGYNTREVDEFLNRVHADVEDMVKEIESLKRKVAAAELIAKDAKDHEEDFIASMQDDKDKAENLLASAKAEGERIIREAKNAASGIMAEVRRRAGDISSESRKASADIIEASKAEADELRANANSEADAVLAGAKAEADKKLFAAKTEADNILKAARTEAAATKDDAKRQADALTADAAQSAALYEGYIEEIRSAAEKLCFEIDAELKNSASRIALLGRRISSAEIPVKPEETDDSDMTVVAPAEEPVYEEEHAPAHASVPCVEDEIEETPAEGESSVGYFSQEYKLAMSELFGEDAEVSDIPSDNLPEDDDTYDYLDNLKVMVNYSAEDDADDSADDSDDNIVTSEYTGILSSGKEADASDLLDDDTLDRVYRAPSQEDIDDILNG